MTIYLVRHGETEWNIEGRRQGRLDSDLTSKGKRQAKQVAERLRTQLGETHNVTFQSSPLGRAWKTTEIICQQIGYPLSEIVSNDLLAECDLGAWGGLTKDEVERAYPGQQAARDADKWNYVIPEGESYVMVSERAKEWLSQLPERSVIVAATHEMMSRAIQGRYLELTPADTLERSHPQDCVYKMSQGTIEPLIAD